jgi:hypothetical protein
LYQLERVVWSEESQLLQRAPDVFSEVRREDSQKQEVQVDSVPATQLSWAEFNTLQSIPHCGKVDEALVGIGFEAAKVVVNRVEVQAKSRQARRRVMVTVGEIAMQDLVGSRRGSGHIKRGILAAVRCRRRKSKY